MTLTDIVKRNYVSTTRKAGEAISAGDLVYLSAADTVSKVDNASCSKLAFEGVAVNTVASGSYVTVAVEPSEVYVNATATLNITAGGYVVPSASGAGVQNYGQEDAAGTIIVGRAITGGTSTSPPLIRLMNVPNFSTEY